MSEAEVIELISEIIKIREKYEHLAEVSYPIWKQRFENDKNNEPNQSVMEVLKMQNLDEAIKLHDQIADSYKDTVPDCDEARKHRQLAKWLRELKAYRKMYREQHQDDYLRYSVMRDATPEELKSANDYVRSISKETDVNFNDFLPE